jgi:hypothetical protein
MVSQFRIVDFTRKFVLFRIQHIKIVKYLSIFVNNRTCSNFCAEKQPHQSGNPAARDWMNRMNRSKPNATTMFWSGTFASAIALSGCSNTQLGTTDDINRLEMQAPKPRAQSIAGGPDNVAPAVFEVTDAAVWDGRPSLGNIWVEIPQAMQPERVRIKNEETGQILTGAMFVSGEDVDRDAPIKLSSAAAEALGVRANSPVTLTVTALRRKAPQSDAAPVQIAQTQAPDPMRPMQPLDVEDLYMPAPQVALSTPDIMPAPDAGDFVQVAEALTADSALRIQEQLEAQEIAADVQEDYIDGLSVYRVFASKFTERDTLAGALENIRFANTAEGDSDGTIIAEMPNFDVDTAATEQARWMEVGTYPSRNEAMAVVQRLSRRSVSAEICDITRGSSAAFRVFGGPAIADDVPVVALDTVSFCAGVAAASFGPQLSSPVAISTRPVDPLPLPMENSNADALVPNGPVRIRVGEATGGLKLSVPEPYSQPITINAAGTIVTLPVNTPPEQVRDIVAALATVQVQIEAEVPNAGSFMTTMEQKGDIYGPSY